MPPGWWFLLFSGVTAALQCYKDSQLILAEEEIEYGTNTTSTNDTTRRCVVFRGHNGTHKMAQRGIWEAHSLPYECLAYGEHCFSYRRFKKMPSFGCCCNTSRCNEKDDAVYMFYPKGFNPSFGTTVLTITRCFLCFVGSITVPIWITALVTFVYVKIKKCVKKKRVLTQYEEEQRLINYDVDGSWSDDEELESLHPRPLPVEVRQSISNKGVRIRKLHTTTTTTTTTANNTSTMTANRGSSSSSQKVASTPLDPTPADSIAKFSKHTLEAFTPPEATTPEYTRSTQKTEIQSTKTAPQNQAPQRPKSAVTKTASQNQAPQVPKSVLLPNGRVQKVSMMEDDEWDD